MDGMTIARDVATFLGAAGTLVFLYDRFGTPMRRLVVRATAWRLEDQQSNREPNRGDHDRRVRRVGYAVAMLFCFATFVIWDAKATMIASILWFLVVGAIGQRVDYRTSKYVFEFAVASSMFAFFVGTLISMLLLLVEVLVARPSAVVVAALLFISVSVACAWAAEHWF